MDILDISFNSTCSFEALFSSIDHEKIESNSIQPGEM